MKKLTNDCINWIREYFGNTPNCKAIIGISGGKDSTIVAALCKEAIGKDRVIGVLMPNGKQSDIEDSYAVCKFLDIQHMTVDISSMYGDFTRTIFNASDCIKEISEQTKINLAPRIRMTTLYAIAQSINGRVANTSNLDESLVGYCTLWGDNVGDFAPLKNLHVSEVLEIGDDLHLPFEMVHKAPADGLTGLSDEEKLGFSYSDVEKASNLIINEELSELENEIKSKIQSAAWKSKMVNIPSFKKEIVNITEKEVKEHFSSLTQERLEKIKNRIADFLCTVQGDIEMFQYECETNKWNDDVLYDVKDACLKLGFSLATFHNWFKDIE